MGRAPFAGVRRSLVWLLLAGLLAGCGADPEGEPRPAASRSTSSPTGVPTPTPDPTPAEPPRGTVAPPWLGTRVLPETPDGYGEVRPTPRILRVRRWNLPDTVPPLPGTGFQAIVADPAPDHVLDRSTWRPGCPVGRDDLAWIRMTYWGFDQGRHSGELLVHGSVAADLVEVFRGLYRVRYPIEAMGIERHADLDAPPTGDGNLTGSFSCRAVSGGGTEFSQHAYGLAVDLNPFQNPYRKGGLVLPELASSYLDRGWHRPGMIAADGPVVRAFAGIGWEWGGAWSSLVDYQHFSLNGR